MKKKLKKLDAGKQIEKRKSFLCSAGRGGIALMMFMARSFLLQLLAQENNKDLFRWLLQKRQNYFLE
jgi:hypothetical protein